MSSRKLTAREVANVSIQNKQLHDVASCDSIWKDLAMNEHQALSQRNTISPQNLQEIFKSDINWKTRYQILQLVPSYFFEVANEIHKLRTQTSQTDSSSFTRSMEAFLPLLPLIRKFDYLLTKLSTFRCLLEDLHFWFLYKPNVMFSCLEFLDPEDCQPSEQSDVEDPSMGKKTSSLKFKNSHDPSTLNCTLNWVSCRYAFCAKESGRRVVKMTQSFGAKIQRNAFNKIPRELVDSKSSLCTFNRLRNLKLYSTKFNSFSPEEKFVYCRNCGHKMVWQIPKGDSKQRHICKECGYIDYQNPKMIVGCIAEHEDKILLCKRGIEPCRGRWTLPAGFLELGESSADGAMRETLEEANAKVSIISMFSMIDIPVIGQSYILFRAKLTEPIFHKPGPETLQTKLFHPTEIPFDQIAFSSISESLKAYERDLCDGVFRFHHGVISKKPGSSPNDPSAFKFHNYIVH